MGTLTVALISGTGGVPLLPKARQVCPSTWERRAGCLVPGGECPAGKALPETPAVCGRLATRGSAMSVQHQHRAPRAVDQAGRQPRLGSSWETQGNSLLCPFLLKISQKQLDARILGTVWLEFVESLNSGCSLRSVANPGVASAGILVAQRAALCSQHLKT